MHKKLLKIVENLPIFFYLGPIPPNARKSLKILENHKNRPKIKQCMENLGWAGAPGPTPLGRRP